MRSFSIFKQQDFSHEDLSFGTTLPWVVHLNSEEADGHHLFHLPSEQMFMD